MLIRACLLLAGLLGFLPAGEAAVRFATEQASLSLSTPKHATALPVEIPLLGATTAADFAALSVTVTPKLDHQPAPRIDSARRALIFTPRPSHQTSTYTIRDSRKPDFTLNFYVQHSSDFFTLHPRITRYLPDGKPVTLTDQGLAIFGGGAASPPDFLHLFGGESSDFTLSSDGQHAYVLIPLAREVVTVDLPARRISARAKLADFDPGDFWKARHARIAAGVAGQVFTLDSNPAGGRVRRHALSSGKTLQTLQAPPSGARWSDLAPSPDGSALWLHASASARTIVFRAPLAANGAAGALSATFDHEGTAPFSGTGDTTARLLLSGDGSRLVIDRHLLALDTGSPTARLLATLPQRALLLTPRARLVVTDHWILDAGSGELFPVPRLPQEYFPALILFGDTLRTLATRPIKLTESYRAHVLGHRFMPGDGRDVIPSPHLTWPAFPGASHTLVSLQEIARDGVAMAADVVAPGTQVMSPEITLAEALRPGSTYRWRLQPRGFSGLNEADSQAFQPDFTGEFTVREVAPETHRLDLLTLQELSHRRARLPLHAVSADTPWTVHSDQPWLQPATASGRGDLDLDLRIDSRGLPIGDAPPATLKISTARSTSSVTVTLRVLPVHLHGLLSPPASPISFAVAFPTAGDQQAFPWVVGIDPFTGSLLEGAPVPAALRPYADHERDRVAHLLHHPAEQSIYLGTIHKTETRHQGRVWRLIEAPFSLHEVAAYPASDFTSARTLQPAGSGRLFVSLLESYQAPGTLLIDAQTGALTPGPTGYHHPNNVVWVSPDQAHCLRLSSTKNGNQMEKLSLTPPFPRVAAREAPGNPPWERVGPDLLRNRSSSTGYYDFDLQEASAPPASWPEDPLEFHEDGSLILGRSLAFSRDEPSAARVVGGHVSLRAYNSFAKRFLTAESGTIVSRQWNELPLASTPAAAGVADGRGRFVFDLTPHLSVTGSVVARVRRTGEESWELQSLFAATANGAMVAHLAPETDYEIQIRRIVDGISTNWSEPLAFRTPQRAPAWISPLSYVRLRQKGEFALGSLVSGETLAFSADGLPEGLALDPSTGVLSDHGASPGRYQFTITVTNPSGSFSRKVNLSVQDTASTYPFARYTGLLDLDGGPLAGAWTATRSGSLLTGTYRSAVFTRSFRIRFDTIPAGQDPERLHAYGATTYKGVPIYLYFDWDRITNQLSLYAFTSDLVEDFHAISVPEIGGVSHWGKTAPYPHAARYTGLLLPGGDGEGARPDGAGFLTATIGSDGAIRITGENALGAKFTLSTLVADDESLPLFHFRGASLLYGGLSLGPIGPAKHRLFGEIAWARDARRGAAYPGGFVQELLVAGAPLPEMRKGQAPLLPFAASESPPELHLADGALPAHSKSISQLLTPAGNALAAPKAGTPENPHRVAVKLNPKTGLVTGSAAVLDKTTQSKPVRTIRFRGMFVKDLLGDGADLVGGYFLLPDANGKIGSGALSITGPETGYEGDD